MKEDFVLRECFFWYAACEWAVVEQLELLLFFLSCDHVTGLLLSSQYSLLTNIALSREKSKVHEKLQVSGGIVRTPSGAAR